MSYTRNGSVRCDGCGRISRQQIGEYTRADGSAGYIHAPGWDPDGVSDYCEECREKGPPMPKPEATPAQVAARDRAVLDARKEARELRRHLTELTGAVRSAIRLLDAEMMKSPPSGSRGKRIARILSALELVNDQARHFGLGQDLKAEEDQPR